MLRAKKTLEIVYTFRLGICHVHNAAAAHSYPMQHQLPVRFGLPREFTA